MAADAVPRDKTTCHHNKKCCDVPECGKITLASLDLEEPSEERDGFVAGSHGGNSNKSCNYSGESQDKVQNSHYFLQSVSGQQYFAF
ncbi:hypothetical protein V6N11_078902 [Hibiscus sabdariffa]|uniref:Uncharacterized protein n=1 Tax=Hibiscus sabdariffa TaxID=183260 RepID=A0ABR2RUL5_9ROSI